MRRSTEYLLYIPMIAHIHTVKTLTFILDKRRLFRFNVMYILNHVIYMLLYIVKGVLHK